MKLYPAQKRAENVRKARQIGVRRQADRLRKLIAYRCNQAKAALRRFGPNNPLALKYLREAAALERRLYRFGSNKAKGKEATM